MRELRSHCLARHTSLRLKDLLEAAVRVKGSGVLFLLWLVQGLTCHGHPWINSKLASTSVSFHSPEEFSVSS